MLYRRRATYAAKLAGTSKGTRCTISALSYLRLHRLDEAITSFNEALSKHRAWGVLVGEANTLKHLGEAQAEAGAAAEARASLAAALGIYEQIGDQAEVAATAALLAPLTAG